MTAIDDDLRAMVRRLEWKKNASNSVWTGELPFNFYYTADSETFGWRVLRGQFMSEAGTEEIAFHPDLAVAQAAAQRDFEDLILSAFDLPALASYRSKGEVVSTGEHAGLLREQLTGVHTFSIAEIAIQGLTRKNIFNAAAYLVRRGELARDAYGKYRVLALRPTGYRPTILRLGDEYGDPRWQFVERDVATVTGQVFAANVEKLTDFDGNLVGFTIYEPGQPSTVGVTEEEVEAAITAWRQVVGLSPGQYLPVTRYDKDKDGGVTDILIPFGETMMDAMRAALTASREAGSGK